MPTELAPIYLNQPFILISQCLLGDPVRYDGAHKQHNIINQHLLPLVQVQPLCPEMAAGMGVPRPAIRRQIDANKVGIALADSGLPIKTNLITTSRELAASAPARQAVGAILKARSPSCGIGTSPLFDPQGQIISTGNGVFAEALGETQPSLLLIDEEQLTSSNSCLLFLRLCQIAMAWRLGSLSEQWRGYLNAAHPLHKKPGLGLQELALKLGRAQGLQYLEPLPFRNR